MVGSNKKSIKSSGSKRVNSFFAGIGGFDLAFETQGFVTTFYCENNEFCRSVLKRHWPNTNNFRDIKELTAFEIPDAEVWTAGFPCQDLSLARTPHGKRNGLKGTQSGLFYTFLDLLSVRKPKVVLLENVAGLLSSHKGKDFNTLLNSLTELGYAVSWRVLNARYFGAPQSRPRVFICAWHGSPEKAVRALYEDNISHKPKNERQGFLKEYKCEETGISVPQISFCISATSGRHTGLDWARTYISYSDKVRRLTPLECERLQGLPNDWTLPDNDYVIPIKGIETSRYHAIGNAVCVPVVKWISSRISKLLEEDTCTVEPFELLTKKVMSKSAAIEELSSDKEEYKWKSGGASFERFYVSVPVSPSPLTPVESQLIDIIEKNDVHERYFLSVNAVQGILRRVDKLGRNLFSPLDTTLRLIAKATPEPGDVNDDYIDNKLIVNKIGCS